MQNDDTTAVADERETLLQELLALRVDLIQGAASRLRTLSWVDESGRYPDSAHNLAHYLALRCRDLRELQIRLARQGLSSLGRVEAHVLASIDQVIRVLAQLGGAPDPGLEPLAPGFDAGNALLTINTRKLFGPPQPRRAVRIMVTLPPEAASDEGLVQAMLESGMDCARINCAHDGAESWRRMIEHLRRAQASVGRECRVLMDLAGHKIRTGALDAAPTCTEVRPRRGESDSAAMPARLLLLPYAGAPVPPTDTPVQACLVLEAKVSGRIRRGDRLEFTDLRGRKRHLAIEKALEGGGWLALAFRKTRFGPDTAMQVVRMRFGRWTPIREPVIRLTGHRPAPVKIRLQPGDRLRLTDPELPGRPARRDPAGQVLEPARIGITAAPILQRVGPGQPVWIDDGKAGAVVEAVHADAVLLRITQTPPGGLRLKADKGINFPGAALELGPLSAKRTLDAILCRMQDHQLKKMPQLRALQLAQDGMAAAVRPMRSSLASAVPDAGESRPASAHSGSSTTEAVPLDLTGWVES